MPAFLNRAKSETRSLPTKFECVVKTFRVVDKILVFCFKKAAPFSLRTVLTMMNSLMRDRKNVEYFQILITIGIFSLEHIDGKDEDEAFSDSLISYPFLLRIPSPKKRVSAVRLVIVKYINSFHEIYLLEKKAFAELCPESPVGRPAKKQSNSGSNTEIIDEFDEMERIYMSWDEDFEPETTPLPIPAPLPKSFLDTFLLDRSFEERHIPEINESLEKAKRKKRDRNRTATSDRESPKSKKRESNIDLYLLRRISSNICSCPSRLDSSKLNGDKKELALHGKENIDNIDVMVPCYRLEYDSKDTSHDGSNICDTCGLRIHNKKHQRLVKMRRYESQFGVASKLVLGCDEERPVTLGDVGDNEVRWHWNGLRHLENSK